MWINIGVNWWYPDIRNYWLCVCVSVGYVDVSGRLEGGGSVGTCVAVKDITEARRKQTVQPPDPTSLPFIWISWPHTEKKSSFKTFNNNKKKENWLLFRLHIAANFRGIEYLNSLIIEIIAINPEREWSSFSDDLNAPLSIARTRRCKRRIKHKKMMMMMKKQKKKEEVLL